MFVITVRNESQSFLTASTSVEAERLPLLQFERLGVKQQKREQGCTEGGVLKYL